MYARHNHLRFLMMPHSKHYLLTCEFIRQTKIILNVQSRTHLAICDEIRMQTQNKTERMLKVSSSYILQKPFFSVLLNIAVLKKIHKIHMKTARLLLKGFYGRYFQNGFFHTTASSH